MDREKDRQTDNINLRGSPLESVPQTETRRIECDLNWIPIHHHLQPLGWDTHNYIIKYIVKWDLETHLSVDGAMKIVAHSTKSKWVRPTMTKVCVCFDSTQSVIVVVEWRTDPANGEHVADWIVSGQAGSCGGKERLDNNNNNHPVILGMHNYCGSGLVTAKDA